MLHRGHKGRSQMADLTRTSEAVAGCAGSSASGSAGSASANVLSLEAADTTVLLACPAGGLPEIVYWGPAPAHESADAPEHDASRRLSFWPQCDGPERLSLSPSPAYGFSGYPGIELHSDGRHTLPRFAIVAIRRGQESLAFELAADDARLTLTIETRLHPASGVLTIVSELINRSDSCYSLQWLTAAALPLPAEYRDVLTFRGRWGREFQPARQTLNDGLLMKESRVGRTSHHSFPGLLIGSPAFDDEQGSVRALHLGWSGNHRLLVERLRDDRIQVQLGELLLPGEVRLQPEERYRSPTLFAAWSETGLNGIRRQLHRYARADVIPGPGRLRQRPVHFNTWDAVRFDHDSQALDTLVGLAADIGVERFVLDDGWFRGRDDDRAGLGDWYVCERKYPDGLRWLVDRVHLAGMEFGLWFEPEMVNEDSDILRAHPDWRLGDLRQPLPRGRNQYALDLDRADVREYLLERLISLVRQYDIAYLKWDMNRDLIHPVSDGRPAARRQTMRVYELIDELRRSCPGIEVEACASGGARADYAMLKRTERIWPSDCHDPLERQTIQRSFSLFFPPEVMGAHIGPRRCSVTGRSYSPSLSALGTLFGHMGVEADLRDFSATELETLAAAIGIYRDNRDWLHCAETVWLPHDELSICMMLAAAGDQALVSVIHGSASRNWPPSALALPGLPAATRYQVSILFDTQNAAGTAAGAESMQTATGRELADRGVTLPPLGPASGVLLQALAVGGRK